MMKSEGRALCGARFLFPPALLALALFALLWHGTRPCIAVYAESGLLASCPADTVTEFSTRFIHSVQKTPVEEFFSVNNTRDGFVLRKTRYRSFGVGLPFLGTEGTFRQEGDDFVMDDMNRPMPEIRLRPGVSTELALHLAGEAIPLCERVPLGSLVRIAIVPRWRLWTDKFHCFENAAR